MAERSAKRVKISRGDDDYMPGNIIDIEIRNFMTFDKLKCQPASRLNLVVGPNGSGKSSLVCAIALGLGGEPQLLGRASTIGAFVKRGEESGHIKITLKGSSNDEQITIMRKIDIHNKSEWLYNGVGIPKKDVGEIVKKFNIQVNNLTQFLPQDRVCEFAKLTPVQLLEETEKAVGDPRLPVQHRALISKSHELRNLERAVRQNRETLDQLKSLNAEQERDVERVRQRGELLTKVDSMRKKVPWLKYDMKKAEYMEAKEKEKDAKKKFDELAKAMNELQGPIEYHRKEKTAQDAKLRKLRATLDGNSKKRLQLAETENILSAQVRGKFKEMEGLRRQEQSRQERILKAKEDLAVAELELANLPQCEPPKDKLDSLGAQILELEGRADNVRSQKREMEKSISQNKGYLARCIDRLRNMEDSKNKSLHALRNSGAERIFEAYKWVNDHRHEFNKDVYGPVLIEVNVKDRVHANYLEGHVAHYIWKAFITQDSGDRDFLVQNLMPFDVVVINHVDEGLNKEPFQVSEEMHAIGIYSRLDRVFEAPPAVKDVLIGQFGLEYSYIGSKATDERANEVQRLGIMDMWTPENHYRWSKSRYGDHVSAVVESVNQSRLLLCNVDVEELESLRNRKTELEGVISDLDSNLKVLQSELRHIEDEAAKLQREREDILNIAQLERKKRRELGSRVNQRRSKVKSLETEENIDTIMANLISSASGLNVQRFQCAIEIKNLLIETLVYRRSSAEQNMTVIELEAKIRELEVGVKEQEKIAVQASQQYEYCKNEAEKYRQQLQAAKKHAESVSMITPELEKLFLEMPSTIEELELAIQEITTEANSILFLNHNILEEYENRQRKIDSLEGKQDTVEVELRRCMDEINALKESWLPTIRDLVAQINDTFSRNFKDMAVAGEVSLDERDIDYENYGILIKVKFREAGQLQVLSAHHQSGGERSVSTILYLVSLQDLTNCPFRVVDEINQGMDPVNERKMFQQLVRAASQPNTPQCFLLTPKLLSDLEYSEACSVINVMNGPWIEQSSKAWSGGGTWTSIVHSLTESRC